MSGGVLERLDWLILSPPSSQQTSRRRHAIGTLPVGFEFLPRFVRQRLVASRQRRVRETIQCSATPRRPLQYALPGLRATDQYVSRQRARFSASERLPAFPQPLHSLRLSATRFVAQRGTSLGEVRPLLRHRSRFELDHEGRFSDDRRLTRFPHAEPLAETSIVDTGASLNAGFSAPNTVDWKVTS